MENKYPDTENIWVWARDVLDRNDLKYAHYMGECPIEYYATYFEVELEKKEDTRKIQTSDLLSFGR